MRPPATLAPIRVGVGENLFTQSDKNWAKVQPFVAPAFRRKALEPRLADIDALIDDEVERDPARHRQSISNSSMGRIALRLAAWVLLGEELDAAAPTRSRVINARSSAGSACDSGSSPASYRSRSARRAQAMKQHRAALDAYADEVIARAQAASARRRRRARRTARARGPAGTRSTPEELRGHVLGLFLAGNETTAAALSWALVHGAQHPDEWAAGPRATRTCARRRSSPSRCG